jgi:hypothetical protein
LVDQPLNAAYFAVREARPGPAVLYAARFDPPFKESAHRVFIDPMMTREGMPMIYHPDDVAPRITRQGGIFTIHNPPDRGLEDLPKGVLTLERIELDAGFRAQLLADLAFYGISSASLFSDLDGLSQFLNWTLESGAASG